MDTALTLVILGAAAAGFVQGFSGTAFSMVALAFWAWAVDPQTAGPMAVFGSLIGQLVALRALRFSFKLRLVAPFVVGGVLGIPVGVWLLGYLDQTMFKAGLGLFLMSWCCVMLAGGELSLFRKADAVSDGFVGWMGGVMGGIGGLAGAVPTLWCTLRGWDRDTQRAVFQSFNLTMHIVTIAVYIASGMITEDALVMFAIIGPALLIPALIGLWLYGLTSAAGFRRVLYLLLFAAGLGLVSSSLPRLLA